MKKLLIISLLIVGCIDEYSPINQGDVYGCTDSTACNFNGDADKDDGSCIYPDENFDCDGNCIAELDCSGECNGDSVELWDVCYGIETTQIDLSEQHLTGEIPPELGNLTNLQGLSLADNQLSGEIPPEIGNLTNLEFLNLAFNQQLSGSIPPEIGNLTNLVGLDLSNNQLSGSIPPEIGNLTNLVYLYIYNNQLSGEIPQEVCDLIESNSLWIDGIISGNNLINTCE